MFPAPDDDRELRPRTVDGDDLLGDRGDGLRVDPELATSEERLAGQLQERPAELGPAGCGGFRDLVGRGAHESILDS